MLAERGEARNNFSNFNSLNSHGNSRRKGKGNKQKEAAPFGSCEDPFTIIHAHTRREGSLRLHKFGIFISRNEAQRERAQHFVGYILPYYFRFTFDHSWD